MLQSISTVPKLEKPQWHAHGSETCPHSPHDKEGNIRSDMSALQKSICTTAQFPKARFVRAFMLPNNCFRDTTWWDTTAQEN